MNVRRPAKQSRVVKKGFGAFIYALRRQHYDNFRAMSVEGKRTFWRCLGAPLRWCVWEVKTDPFPLRWARITRPILMYKTENGGELGKWRENTTQRRMFLFNTQLAREHGTCLIFSAHLAAPWCPGRRERERVDANARLLGLTRFMSKLV